MASFEGYYPETTEILMGIRLNNNKEWYQEHKDAYKQFVHEPTVLLGNEIFEQMKALDKHFNGTPKVSRVNRDMRFSKEKLPYKECKWVMFRADQTPSIMHELPTYFFEVSPEWYRFGFGFWPQPNGMAAFRKKIDANPAEAERLIRSFDSQSTFKLECDTYKRNISAEKSDLIRQWYQCKNLTFICYRNHDGLFCQRGLLDLVAEGFKALYPLYEHFKNIQ